MKDLAFYNVGCDSPRGARSVLILARRLLRRVLRPFFLKQAEIFQYLADRLEAHEHAVFTLRADSEQLKRRIENAEFRQDKADEQLKTTLALGWDHLALVRRLATLEDHVSVLTGTTTTAGDDESRPLIIFPGLDKGDDAADDDDVQSKVV